MPFIYYGDMLSTMDKKRTDSALISAFQAGNVQAFREIYRKYSQGLFNYILFLAGDEDDANDIFQALFLKVIEQVDIFSRARNFKKYLFASARNEVLIFRKKTANRQRRIKPVAEAAKVPARELASGSPVSGGGNEQFQNLFLHMKKLPSIQRETVILHLQQDMSFAEIGALQKQSPKTVASRYYLAVKKLKAWIRVQP
ncbi:RNA polymerase sigma factor [Planctomycetota bacterium]